MEKLNLTKKYKSYFTAKTTPQLVDIEPARYLSLRGKGDPSSEDFTRHIQAIYPVAYGVKAIFKAKDKDFVVSKLEGQWWYDEEKFKGFNMDDAMMGVPRSEWEFRLLIRMPDYVEKEDVEQAIETTINKKGIELARNIEFFKMEEGKCVQAMHIGPFDTEQETLTKMLDFIREHKLGRNGLHHEIYLSDFRRVAAEKLKTILREPVK